MAKAPKKIGKRSRTVSTSSIIRKAALRIVRTEGMLPLDLLREELERKLKRPLRSDFLLVTLVGGGGSEDFTVFLTAGKTPLVSGKK